MIDKKKVIELNKLFSKYTEKQILDWVYDNFSKDEVVVTSSFQTQSTPLLHIISEQNYNFNILFINTGFHFKETIQFKEKLREIFKLNIIETSSLLGKKEFLKKYGKLYKNNPQMCCYLNKVEPLQRTLKKFKVWISGIRRDQTDLRKESEYIQVINENLIKVCPLLDWKQKDIDKYIKIHKLPTHPLYKEGYLSIGCEPCTSPVEDKFEFRNGRWNGSKKTECGIHYINGKVKKKE